MNYQVLVSPILLLAGLGEMCSIGDVVFNPFLGPHFKEAVASEVDWGENAKKAFGKFDKAVSKLRSTILVRTQRAT